MSDTLIRIPRPDDWHLHVRDGDAMISLMKSTFFFSNPSHCGRIRNQNQ